MARIRSVHPGLFTDADWVECSLEARLLIIGLWTYADDQGTFVWRPKEIKMAIFPGDNADVVPLLEELKANNLLRSYEAEGRTYGAIRNFRKWQRPQKPTAIHPLPESVAQYVGLSRNGTQPLPDPYDSDQGNLIQMEEVGGRSKRKEEVRVSNETLTPGAGASFSEFKRAYPKPDKLGMAAKLWAEATKTTPPDEIICGLRAWLGEWRRRYGSEIRYIPNACDFLSTRQWVEAPTESSGTAPPLAPAWSGPPKIRQTVVAARSETFAKSYLDPCDWDEGLAKIITPTTIAAEKLRAIGDITDLIGGKRRERLA